MKASWKRWGVIGREYATKKERGRRRIGGSYFSRMGLRIGPRNGQLLVLAKRVMPGSRKKRLAERRTGSEGYRPREELACVKIAFRLGFGGKFFWGKGREGTEGGRELLEGGVAREWEELLGL